MKKLRSGIQLEQNSIQHCQMILIHHDLRAMVDIGFKKDVHGCKNVIWNKDYNNRECGFLYCNGNWAEVINKPQIMCTEKNN